ncbi:restriction endonuclease S subunit [Staphylococcus equorum subsp. equorum Mu2]|uniref:restriction endonuclease subunit S n=1 Tax=Staphylococcus equorum TaxID=246432 RepID=UPI000267DBE8|nr:restriction endonuclease subunit S [Staphylococcus equorum]CCI61260.1 restriction endonuclease S subunit [Staphylococcus equorum subsp. equorum Mu2]
MTNEIKNMPELRFSGFSEEWKKKKLEEIAYINDGTHMTPNYVQAGIPFFSVENVTRNDFVNSKFVTEEAYEKYKKRIDIEYNDILMTRIGSIGKVKLVNWIHSTTFYVSLALLKIHEGFVPQYISYLLESFKVQKSIMSNSLVTAVPQKINLIDLKKVDIVLTISINEQQRIGDFFSKLDRQIELEEQKLEKLEEQKKGYMQKIFSQELRFKDGNGNNYSEWIKTNLKFLVSYKNGKGYEKEVVQNGKYNIINLNSISTKGMLKDSGKYTDFEDITLKKNDLIMILSDVAKGNLIGKTAIIDQDDKYLLNQRVASLRIKDESTSNVLFIYYFINYFRQYFINMSTGMSQLNINKSTVEDFLIYLPYIEEQDKIGNFFSNLDKSIIKQLDKIELLKERKKGFLQKMFV